LRENRFRRASLLAVVSFPAVMLVQASATPTSPRAAPETRARIVVSTAAESLYWDAPDPYSYRPITGAPVQDGLLTLVVGGASGHVMHVVETGTRIPIWTRVFDETITGVAIHAASAQAAVSTAAGTYLLDLDTGELELRFPEESGQLDFDASGRRLVLLRSTTSSRELFRPHSASDPEFADLVLLDVHRASIVWQRPTRIRIPRYVAIEGTRVEAFGGGAHRVELTKRMVPEAAHRVCFASVELESGATIEEDCGYGASTLPRAAAIRKQLSEPPIAPVGIPSRTFDLLESTFAGGAFLILNRSAEQLASKVQRSHSLLRLAASSGLSVDPLVGPIGSDVRFVGDRLVDVRWMQAEDRNSRYRSLVDVRSGQELYRLPYRDSQDREGPFYERWHPWGVLERAWHGRWLSFYPPLAEGATTIAAAWVAPYDPRIPMSESPDGSRLVRGVDPDGRYLEIVEVRSGKVLHLISSPIVREPKKLLRLAFDRSNRRILARSGRHAGIYDLVTGAWTSVDDHGAWESSSAWGLEDGWLLSGGAGNRILGGDGRSGPSLEFESVRCIVQPARPASPLARRTLVLESSVGRCALVDLGSGTVRDSWFAREPPRSRTLMEAPRQSASSVLSNDGEVLLRSIGYAGAMEALDLSTTRPELKLTIYPAWSRSRAEVGWIAVTPDGLWDSSPGVEEYVHAYRGSRRLPVAERDAQRDGEEIARRLRRLLKR